MTEVASVWSSVPEPSCGERGHELRVVRCRCSLTPPLPLPPPPPPRRPLPNPSALKPPTYVPIFFLLLVYTALIGTGSSNQAGEGGRTSHCCLGVTRATELLHQASFISPVVIFPLPARAFRGASLRMSSLGQPEPLRSAGDAPKWQ